MFTFCELPDAFRLLGEGLRNFRSIRLRSGQTVLGVGVQQGGAPSDSWGRSSSGGFTGSDVEPHLDKNAHRWGIAGPVESDASVAASQEGVVKRCQILTPTARLFHFCSARPEGAFRQWRKVPPRELSIDLVADERLDWVTGWAGAS